MKFISIIISSAPTSDHQALDPGGWGSPEGENRIQCGPMSL